MARILKPLALGAAFAMAAPGAMAADWEGPYIGFYGASTNLSTFDLGSQVGYNFALGGNTYGGVEADILFPSGPTTYVAAGTGRLGYEAAPDLLLYGQAGLTYSSGGSNWWLAGAGAQYALTGNLSLRAGVDRYSRISGTTVNWVAKAGLVYGF